MDHIWHRKSNEVGGQALKQIKKIISKNAVKIQNQKKYSEMFVIDITLAEIYKQKPHTLITHIKFLHLTKLLYRKD